MFPSSGRKVQPNIVRLLLKHGANPNHQLVDGRTALTIAVSENRADMVKVLLKWGADVTIRTSEGYTALEIADRANNHEIDALIRSHNNSPAPREIVKPSSKTTKNLLLMNHHT